MAPKKDKRPTLYAILSDRSLVKGRRTAAGYRWCVVDLVHHSVLSYHHDSGRAQRRRRATGLAGLHEVCPLRPGPCYACDRPPVGVRIEFPGAPAQLACELHRSRCWHLLPTEARCGLPESDPIHDPAHGHRLRHAYDPAPHTDEVEHDTPTVAP